MVARAMEPAAGEKLAGHQPNCLNCGTALTGDYCHCCGQQAHVHRSLGAFGHDIAHSVLHFEGKILRTLPLLAWRPGELTRRYVEGERARFVSPMALFLFSVFLMFATFSIIGGPVGLGPASMQSEVDAERPRLKAQLAKLEAQRAAAAEKKQDVRAIDKEIKEAREELAVINVARGDPPTRDGGDFGIDESANSDNWLNKVYQKAKENPSLLIYKLQNNAYKFSWALIPISVPFLWLLFFWKREFQLYDHTVFITYSIAFMTLLLVVLTLLRPLGLSADWIMGAMTFLPPVHMYRQLRGAYRLSRASALWRALLLAIFATVAASFFMGLLLLIGTAG
jgi:hypothetical protein